MQFWTVRRCSRLTYLLYVNDERCAMFLIISLIGLGRLARHFLSGILRPYFLPPGVERMTYSARYLVELLSFGRLSSGGGPGLNLVVIRSFSDTSNDKFRLTDRRPPAGSAVIKPAAVVECGFLETTVNVR